MDLTTHIPMNWIDAIHRGAPYVLALLVATTVLVHALLPVARAIERWTRSTPATWDDGPARRAVEVLEKIVSAAAIGLLRFPRLTVGDPDAAAEPPEHPPNPPDDDRSGALSLALLIVGAAAYSIATSGCGPTAISAHARGATITAASLSAIGSVVDTARDAALDQVEAEYPTRSLERDAALDEEAARWEPVGAALDAARAALMTWIQAIELARVVGDDVSLVPELLRIAARAVLLYDRVVAALRAAGLDDTGPPLPDIVRALAEAAAPIASSAATTGGAQ